MKHLGSLLLVVAGLSLGCQKNVPEDIVKKAVNGSLRHMSGTASAMCGAKTRGLIDANVTIKTRGEKNTGVAHVKGTPWPQAGEDLPAKCEGDVEYAFSFTTKSYGTGKRRRTETTWFLDKLKLTAVQTDGVKFKGEKEETNDPEADDDEADDKPVEKSSKKKKSDDD